MGIHPLAQICQNLFGGSATEEGFKFCPFAGLSLSDEGEHRFREDRTVAVEIRSGDRHIAVLQEMGFDNRFEGGFVNRFQGGHHTNLAQGRLDR